MAEPLSVRSRSARAGEESTARRQTGALHAAGLDYEGLLPEGGRQDHAGQHYLLCIRRRPQGDGGVRMLARSYPGRS